MLSCNNCLLPETADATSFDETGSCSVCRQIEVRDTQIDWDERHKQMLELVAQYRDKGLYDCIVPFSGGKDSVFQLWYVVRKLGLKPLVVRFDPWFYRPLVDENNTSVFKQLGVDVLNFTPNWHVGRELMLESLKRRGDFCWHCHTGIYAHTMNLGITADDMYEFLGGRVSKRDLYPFVYPPRKELMRIKCRSVCLGSYIRWDTKKNVEVIKRELGWKGQEVEGVPPEYDYEKIECFFQGVRDYLKYIKRGMGRTNHLANIDIRNKRMTRAEGEALVRQYDGKRPPSLDLFLDYLNLTEEQFLGIAIKHEVSPWQFSPNQVEPGRRMPDMDKWDKTKVPWPNHPGVEIKG